jgi:tetratricopeptide (TPR) repeat protein
LPRKSSKSPCIFPTSVPHHQSKAANGRSEKFTQAIEIEPANHVLYSNRSGAYASLKDFDGALEDAEKVTEIKADWPKGWGRKGAALHGQGDLGMIQNLKRHAGPCD